jgi:Tol biopolymer transport system component
MLILLGLGLLLGAIILAGNLAGLPAPVLIPEDRFVGAYGPVTLAFKELVQIESIETRLRLDPPVEGLFRQTQAEDRSGFLITFWPARPLQVGQRYTVSLDAGVRSQSGMELRRAFSWQVSVRPADILYLSPTDRPELWRISTDGQQPTQLTQTDGSIFDYHVSPDGSRIIYSVINEQKGIDIWQLDFLAGSAQVLLPCGADWCSSPTFSPDGTKIAYSRRRSGAFPGEGPGVPRIWLLDLQARSTDALYVDPNIGGFDPVWSPDGRYIAFFDGLSQGVRVLDMLVRTDFLLPSQMGASGQWSPDSQRLLFTNFESSGDSPFVAVYEVDVQTQQIRRVLGEDFDQVDYSVPVWQPDGQMLAVALRLFTGSPSKQLWLLDLEGQQRQSITDNQMFTHASYHWNPGGNLLVFQRLELGKAHTLPQIALWDRQTGQTLLLAENAFQPHWKP